MYQNLTVVGRLGKEPEMRYTPNGNAVTNFSIAVSRKYKSGDEPKEETTWFRVQVWGKQAEACNQYLGKGSLVLVEGTLIPDENGGPKVWKAQDGTSKASFEVRAETVRFFDKKKEGEPAEEL